MEEQREDRPNAVYCRDLMFMTPEGAIISRPALPVRRGEEAAMAKALAAIQCSYRQNDYRNRYIRGGRLPLGGPRDCNTCWKFADE